MLRSSAWAIALAPLLCVGCGGNDDGNAEAGSCKAGAPAPDAFTPISGPGGPKGAFSAAPSATPCAFLDGGENDPDHHNGLFMIDGYLVMPWAPEWADGGISVFDFSDACSPKRLNTVDAVAMRETHATGLSQHAGRWMAVTHLKGISFWDISDVTNPVFGSTIELPGVFYPDAYARVVMSLFWQAPYVYVAGADNGLYIVDASDPLNPELVGTYNFELPLRAGAIFAVGNLMAVSAAEGTRTTLLDISDPTTPAPIPGGTFEVTDETGTPREVYHSHLNGDKMWYARKGGGGGLIVYDIANTSAPSYLGGNSPPNSNGGYVFIKDQRAFVGESNFGDVFDVSNPTQVVLEHTFHLQAEGDLESDPGDFDTLVPLGNVVIAASDESDKTDAYPDGAVEGRASQVFALDSAPDTQGPQVTMVNPSANAVGVRTSARIGITLSEFVELGSVFEGSFQVFKSGCSKPLAGYYSGQEGILNFWPAEPLEPRTSYEVVIPAGGITDYLGNPTSEEFRSSFTTSD
ncbi:MAG: Ig-like domain-containing protein [Polyangiaceae bacterium]|nr:Ig-like domain-containing protein [Myxococcales bacterium]MCB9587803.1 Ig-like domain-containing protein [Polyangiaceae bacterium]MCB9608752.1 Ig-like domain-containing protein [Polyangiaceae bacterium]